MMVSGGMILAKIGDLFQEADWKKEKHVPVIECPSTVKADVLFEVKVGIGKEIAHPNTTEHHIRWITLFFHPKGEKFPYQIGRFEFTAHGESVQGPNTSSVYTHHAVTASFKTSKPGTILALAFCNIHGLWQSSKEITL
jgi:superoxide reductase